MLQKRINESYRMIHEFKHLLSTTDFHVTKLSDPSASPYEIPEEIIDARRNARSEINRLEGEIATLEEELRNHVETIDDMEL